MTSVHRLYRHVLVNCRIFVLIKVLKDCVHMYDKFFSVLTGSLKVEIGLDEANFPILIIGVTLEYILIAVSIHVTHI